MLRWFIFFSERTDAQMFFGLNIKKLKNSKQILLVYLNVIWLLHLIIN